MQNPLTITNKILKNYISPRAYYALFSALKGEFFGFGKYQPHQNSLLSCANWLLGQQTKEGGFIDQYSLLYGSCLLFPETTGYIIPTLISLSSETKDGKYLQSAKKGGAWLLQIQNKDGSFGQAGSNEPMIFDSGQIIFGLLALYKELNERKFLDAARHCADWICAQQESDGSWRKYAYNKIAHSYYSRVSLALLKLWQETKEEKYKTSATRQLDWVLIQQQDDGFYLHCSFFDDDIAPLHTIAYTIEGLLESGILLGRQNEGEKYFQSAQKACKKLLELNRQPNYLPGYFSSNWAAADASRCLTGLAQTACNFVRLFEETNENEFLKEARSISRYVQSKQPQAAPKEINGALAGSAPFWGKYMPFGYINWAAKFFIDCLLLLEKHKGKFLTLAVVPTDSLKMYLKKGEMRKNYWNPQSMFSEIHIFDFGGEKYSEEEKNHLSFMTGQAELFIHTMPKFGFYSIIKSKKITSQAVNDLAGAPIDVLRCHGVFYEGFFGRALAKKLNCPLLLSLHGDYDLDIRGQILRQKKYLKYLSYVIWKLIFEIGILKSANAIIGVYRFAVNYALRNGVEESKTFLIYNRVDEKMFYSNPAITQNKEFTILSVSRLIPEKNQKNLIAAIKDLPCRLILVGQGPEQEALKNLAKELKISEKVEFIPKINNKNMPELYNRCHAYATANLYGGVEIAMIEAMACGLPVIRSKHQTEKSPELVGLNDCVFVENSPQGFSAGIKKLIEDKNLYACLSQGSLKIFSQICGSNMEAKEKTVYSQII
ncbi:MAG: glycosyltransferase [Candidatus Paceibacterota bacterium]